MRTMTSGDDDDDDDDAGLGNAKELAELESAEATKAPPEVIRQKKEAVAAKKAEVAKGKGKGGAC
jgi:hypothetical protein